MLTALVLFITSYAFTPTSHHEHQNNCLKVSSCATDSVIVVITFAFGYSYY